MSGDTRNTKVVVGLILAMTAGARVLLWLEPDPGTSVSGTPLTAVGGTPIEDVLIEYASPDEVADADFLVLPDGSCQWDLLDPHMRLVVVGSADDELSRAQKESLLAALGSMTLARGGKPVQVRLHPDSDVRYQPGLRAQAHDLRELLASKRFIE